MGSALLKVIGEGCLYGHPWLYADDIILLSPSRTGLQEMVKTLPNLVQKFKSKYEKLNALFFLKKG